MERDPEVVRVDVDRGIVTQEGAKRYGVVIDDDGAVNQAATNKLRKKMIADRGEQGLFNFGGTIDEIKARALEETHLPPPEAPVF
jgi:N-methylhydantoinase B